MTDKRVSEMTNEEIRTELLGLPKQGQAAVDVDQLAAKIKDAYYHARDHGGTMHTAADDAVAAILPIIQYALADAWDEGYKLDWTGGMKWDNPYRGDAR